MSMQKMRETGVTPYGNIIGSSAKGFSQKVKQNKFLPKGGPEVDQIVRRVAAVALTTSTLTPKQIAEKLGSFPNAENIVRQLHLDMQAGKNLNAYV